MDSAAPLRASWAAPLAADRLRRRYSAAESDAPSSAVGGAGSQPSTSASSASSAAPRPALRPTGASGLPPRLPYCIVWTPLPFITWLLPFIGHMGICDSRGAVYDFAGPYTIGVDEMAFAAPTRYLVLDPAAAAPDARFREAALARAAAGGAGGGGHQARVAGEVREVLEELQHLRARGGGGGGGGVLLQLPLSCGHNMPWLSGEAAVLATALREAVPALRR